MSLNVLFTGYAPVHYTCFRPVHHALGRIEGVNVHFSGGVRSRNSAGEWEFDGPGLFGPFGIEPEAVLTIEEIQERDFDVLFCANTKAIKPRSARKTIEIFHGVSFRNLAVRAENAGKDAYFVVGPYMRRAMEHHGMLPAGDPRAVEVGFPKTDRLLDGSLDPTAILAAEGLSGERPVLVYAPTGAVANSLETMGEDVLRALKAAGSFDVLIKLHDHPKNQIDWRGRLAPLEDEHLRVARTPDVVECLLVADLLISDASSVANEFAHLDRPMIFLDVPELIEVARTRPESALDLETWGRRAGDVVAGPDAVVRAVDEALAKPERHSDIRRAMATDLFYNPGRATGAAVSWLVEEFELA